MGIFGTNIEEDFEDKEYEERRKKIEEYLNTLDPKKRKWEEKKVEHYRVMGKQYLLPGEKPKAKKSLMVTEQTMTIPEKHLFPDGSLKMLSIQHDA